jgi:hypothetical protein
MRKTGLTACQVTYRLHKEGIKRMDYRNGDSQFSQKMLQVGRTIFEQSVLSRLAKNYPPRKR